MSILKQHTNRQGITLGYHRVVQVIVDKDGVHANVHSWPTPDQFEATVDGNMPRGQGYHNLPANVTTLADAEQWLVSDAESEFFAGEIQVESTGLEVAKANRLRQLLVQRDMLEFAGVNVPGLGVIGTDAASQRLLTGTVLLALLAAAAGSPFLVAWTLKDGTTVVNLDGQSAGAAAVAVGQYVGAVYEAHRAAVNAVATAETVEAVNAVSITL